MTPPGTLVIGAGPAGLAVSACLRRKSLPHTVVERAGQVANSWRRHYERLHLHTAKQHSALPGMAWPRDVPRYPSRLQVIEYLDRYAAEQAVVPRFGVEVRCVERDGEGFRVETSEGPMQARSVVVATGNNRVPHRPTIAGLDRFEGRVMHSSEYRNAGPFAGQRVLVVGCGNSGAEIALDLAEQGVEVSMVVRGPVHVVPRDLLGNPSQRTAILLSRLPLAMRDAIVAPVLRWAVGDLSRWGIVRPVIGPNRMIEEAGRIPLLDIGTIDGVKAGRIRVLPAIRQASAHGVAFADASEHRFEAIILATGYTPALGSLIEGFDAIAGKRGRPPRQGDAASVPGLHFVGFYNPPTGALRQIALEAKRVAQAIERERGGAGPA